MSERLAYLDLPAFNGGSHNGYNARYTLRLDGGITYRRIMLKLTNLLKAQILRVRLTLNGDSIVDISGENLDMINKYKDHHDDPAWLLLNFTDRTQKALQGQNYSELVTLPGENVILEVTTGLPTAGQVSAGNVAVIEAVAVMGPPRINATTGRPERQTLPRLYEDVLPVGKTGENRFVGFVNQNKTSNPVRIMAMHMVSDTVERLELKKANKSIFRMYKDATNFDLLDFGRVPQVGVYHFDPCATGFAATDATRAYGAQFEFVYTIAAGATPADFMTVFHTVEQLAVPAR